jgi:hypothetical protein
MYGGFVAAALAAAGREHGEREGVWYDEHIKVHEYAGITATAREIRRHGCAPMLVAPFTAQIRDPGRWAGWVAELGGEPVRLVWVGCDVAVLRDRLLARDRSQDSAKIAAFDAWAARLLPATPPPVPHLAVDNSASVGAGARKPDDGGGAGGAGGARNARGAGADENAGAASEAVPDALTRRIRAIAELEGVRAGR